MAPALFLLILLLPNILGYSNPCCQTEDNVVTRKHCSDGNPMKKLSCPYKYLTPATDDVVLDEDNHLLIEQSKIPPDRYCHAIFNNTNMYLICFSEKSYSGTEVFTIYGIMELVSVFFLLVTIFVYLQIGEVLDLQGVCILHAISALAMSFLALATNQLVPEKMEKNLCVFFAYLIYFSMLYSFFWLNVLAFHIWRTTVRPSFLKIKLYWKLTYYIYGCMGPIILVIVLIIAHSMENSETHPGFGERACWFKTTKSQLFYFYGPMSILIFLNIVYYTWTVVFLWRQLNNIDERRTKILKYRLILCLKLFFIMGISWIFEILSAAFDDKNSGTQYIWYFTDTVNTLQGIFIFLILVVFRKRVVRHLADRNFCGLRLPARWRSVADNECDEIEEELNLSETQIPKN